jgi:hypothetical protein
MAKKDKKVEDLLDRWREDVEKGPPPAPPKPKAAGR